MYKKIRKKADREGQILTAAKILNRISLHFTIFKLNNFEYISVNFFYKLKRNSNEKIQYQVQDSV